MTQDRDWQDAEAPLIGIRPIMDWIHDNYGVAYAENTRETVRRHSVHQFLVAGMIVHNPDSPDRPTNSPHSAYQIEPATLCLVKNFGKSTWEESLSKYVEERGTLAARYAAEREQELIPVKIAEDQSISLSPGAHSQLIREIIESFGARFAQGSTLVYVGDTGDKWAHFDKAMLAGIGVELDPHGKMPDVVFYDPDRNWFIHAEAVTSHGPVDAKRHGVFALLRQSAHSPR